MNNIGQPRYGIVDSGIFGLRIVSGIVTGIKYTENQPIYELSFGKDIWNTSIIFDNSEALFSSLSVAPLERIKETHNLKIKFER